MNERRDSVFAKENSLVEVLYVEPSFQESLNVKSLIPRSRYIRMNDMNNIMCYVSYDMFHVKYFMCFLQNNKFDDACYTHGITFQIRIWHFY